MSNGSEESGKASIPGKTITVAGGSSLGTAVIVYALTANQGGLGQNPDDVEAIRRGYERRLDNIERKLEPLVQLPHMIAGMRMDADDTTDSLTEIKKQLSNDLNQLRLRLRDLENVNTQTRVIVEEYQDWVRKLSERTITQKEFMSGVDGRANTLASQLVEIRDELKKVAELQRNVRERLQQIEYQVTHPPPSGQTLKWYEGSGLAPSPPPKR